MATVHTEHDAAAVKVGAHALSRIAYLQGAEGRTLTEAGYRLVPPGRDVREEMQWRVCFAHPDGQQHTQAARNETFADVMLEELADKGISGRKERRSVTTHHGSWEPVND